MQQIKELTTPKNYDKFQQKIPNKQYLLGRFYETTVASLMSPACKGHHQPPNKSKLRRLLDTQLKIHDKLRKVPNTKLTALEKGENQNRVDYEFYKPLNRLWDRYILDLIQKQHNQESKELKILRADFHGGYLTIIDSKNQTLLGLEGIVIKETLRSFQIVLKTTEEKQRKNTKLILKSVCIFLLQVSNQNSFIINGNSLVYRPSDRIRHRFKFKKAEQINHHFVGMLEAAKFDSDQQPSET